MVWRIFCVLLISTMAPAALACSCIPRSLPEAFEVSENVILVRAGAPAAFSGAAAAWEFEALEVYKGNAPTTALWTPHGMHR